MGGGGIKDITREREVEPMSALDILTSVIDPNMIQQVNPGSSVTSLADSFPCVQTISSSLGDVNITISVLPTMTVIATAKNAAPSVVQQISDSNVMRPPLPKDFEADESNSRVCAVCRKTDSDIRSRGGKGLKLCICRAPGLN